jgi:competence protein ComEA
MKGIPRWAELLVLPPGETMCKASRVFEFSLSATLVFLLGGMALVLPLADGYRLASAYCLRGEGQEPRPAQPEASSKLAPATLDVNLASAEDFQKLPGIGPKLAQRIVAYRQKHGLFRRVEDLMAIRGMGFKKWKAMRPYLRVGKQE